MNIFDTAAGYRRRHPYHLAPVLVTPPDGLPVTLADVKTQLRISTDADDLLLTATIASAVDLFDGERGILGRCLLPQVWRARYPGFLALRLPFEPVQSVTSVEYVDTLGETQTLDPTLWRWIDASPVVVVTAHCLGNVVAHCRDDAVSVTFSAGYANADAVPSPIKMAITLATADIYQVIKRTDGIKRDAVEGVGLTDFDTSGAVSVATQAAIDRLIAPYRRVYE